jgi:hypothetical protein
VLWEIEDDDDDEEDLVIVEKVLGAIENDDDENADEGDGDAKGAVVEDVELAVKLVGCEPVDAELEGMDVVLVDEDETCDDSKLEEAICKLEELAAELDETGVVKGQSSASHTQSPPRRL